MIRTDDLEWCGAGHKWNDTSTGAGAGTGAGRGPGPGTGTAYHPPPPATFSATAPTHTTPPTTAQMSGVMRENLRRAFASGRYGEIVSGRNILEGEVGWEDVVRGGGRMAEVNKYVMGVISGKIR